MPFFLRDFSRETVATPRQSSMDKTRSLPPHLAATLRRSKDPTPYPNDAEQQRQKRTEWFLLFFAYYVGY